MKTLTCKCRQCKTVKRKRGRSKQKIQTLQARAARSKVKQLLKMPH